MSPLLIILLTWIGLAASVIATGLAISRRRGPDRYLVMTIVEPERSSTNVATEYREAA